MRRLFLVVLLLALAGTGLAQAEGKFGFGFWEGQRDVGYLAHSYFPISFSALEGGGYLNWEVGDHMALRFQASYFKGDHYTLSINSSGNEYEDRTVVSGFPVEVYVLPTVRVGDRFLFRAGGGLSYYKLTTKETEDFGYPAPVVHSYGVSGYGGQFLLSAEGKLNPNLGLEAQYEKGTAKLSYNTTYSSGYGGTTTRKEGFGTTPEAFRIGLAFHF